MNGVQIMSAVTLPIAWATLCARTVDVQCATVASAVERATHERTISVPAARISIVAPSNGVSNTAVHSTTRGSRPSVQDCSDSSFFSLCTDFSGGPHVRIAVRASPPVPASARHAVTRYSHQRRRDVGQKWTPSNDTLYRPESGEPPLTRSPTVS